MAVYIFIGSEDAKAGLFAWCGMDEVFVDAGQDFLHSHQVHPFPGDSRRVSVFLQPLIVTRFGLFIAIGGLSTYELILMGVVCLAGCLIGMIPGYQIYCYSLADGMTIRI